jgi:hypothetical protein
VTRRILIVAGAVVAIWLLALLVLGVALSSRQERATRERLADSLHAKVTIGAVDLALIRGHLVLDRLAILRDDRTGRLAIEVARVRCELAPLGWALFDRDCRELRVQGLAFEVSSAALFKLPRPAKSEPVRADRVVIEGAKLVFMPAAFAPSLGRIEIAIDHAAAGPTVLRTPLSWLFALRELKARFELPAGVSVHVAYANGVLTASGSLFGSAPVQVPLAIPVADAVTDAHDEMALLLQLGRQTAERLVARRAEDWLRSKLVP